MPAEEDQGLGPRLKDLMAARGVNSRVLGQRMDTDPNQIKRWRASRHWPSMPNMIALAEALDVTIDELVYGPGGRPRPDPGHDEEPPPSDG